MPPNTFFWQQKTLTELSPDEWESLCDGCARCCLHKLEDEDNGDIYYTNVACHLLDLTTCRCTDYPNRSELVPTCLTLTPQMVAALPWLPETCSYHHLAAGKDLEWWHPLICENHHSIHEAGISIRNTAVSAREVGLDHLEDFVTDPPE